MPDAVTDEVPKVHRQFRLLRCLGRGGFGEVYLAEMITTGGLRSRVAIKLLHGGLAPESQAVQRLRDEAKLLGLIEHACIPRVHDLVILEGRVALVVEYLPGLDLTDCIRRRMGGRAALEVVARVADALDIAYNTRSPDRSGLLQLVHRDIKPANIRIGPQGTVHLLDFGIARAKHGDREANTQTAALVGSVPYMAPERFADPDNVDTYCDVFGLGCVLFEALARRQLFPQKSLMEQARLALSPDQWKKHTANALDDLDAELPVVMLLESMLAFDPQDRPTPAALSKRCDQIADKVLGATLRQWARTVEMPDPEDDDPDNEPTGLEGRLMHTELGGSESAEVSGTIEPTVLEPKRSGVRWMMAGAAGMLLGSGASVVAVLAIIAVGVGGWFLLRPEPAPAPAIKAAPSQVKPPPRVRPKKAKKKATPAPKANTPRPKVTLPAPAAPAPEKAPPKPQLGRIEVEGGVSVRLRKDGAFFPPGSLNAGTYVLEARFDDWQPQGDPLKLNDGDVLRFKCSKVMERCRPK